MDRLKMRHLRIAIVFLVALVFSGCAWQRIPVAPEYSASTPLPIRVGIILGNTQPSSVYGPGIANLLKEMRVFESVTYPSREDDPVDGTLKLTITGGWRGAGAGAGFIIGLTLGLASPAVGPSMTGIHDAEVVLSKGTTDVARYSIHVESTVTWGMAANTTEVTNKAEDLQRRKLAVEIARKLDAERALIIKAFGS